MLTNLKLALEEEYGLDPLSVKRYFFVFGHFTEYAGEPPYDKQQVLNYLADLRGGILPWGKRRRKQDSYVNFHRRVLKSCFEALEWPWTLKKRREKVAEPQKPLFRPRLSGDEVATLIEKGKRQLDERQLAYLSLSTTYGLRRIELARVQPKHLNIGEDELTVITAKGGELRIHLLAPEIKPWVKEYSFDERLSTDSLSRIFKQILERCGLKAKKGYGWHSIRRCLTSSLDDTHKLSTLEIHQFMRWKGGRMPISPEQEVVMPAILIPYGERQNKALDSKVFNVHPFLPYWRN